MSTRRPDGNIMVRDFTPGFLDSPESDTLPMGATPDAKNSFLYNIDVERRRAVLGRRLGSRLVFASALASEKVLDGLFEWRSEGTPTLLAVCNGALSSVDPVAGTVAAIGTGWTATTRARMTAFKNDAFVYDGTFQQRWDGSDLYDVGSTAPGTITNLSAGAGSLTGTYEALYTWYNADRDHHSSPSTVTATQVLAGQGRTHTKPGSTAPDWATHWGIWVRRTDTGELNYFFVQNEAIANGTATETVLDVVRQRGQVAPQPDSHNAPPGAWEVLVEKGGLGIGILAGSDSYYVSELGDFESWHPKNRFPVSRATGEPLKWAQTFGTQFLIGTAHRTWQLTGDAVPFKIDPVHPSYGNVSQDACLDVNGKFYGWDRVQGPYVTDLASWRPLGRHRIDNFLADVNRNALDRIQAVHAERYGLIGWAVPTGTSERLRTLLWYSYDLDCWLPPQTGLEYGSVAAFTNSAGVIGIFNGDYWGRVQELFSGDSEGATGTDDARVGTVVSSTNGTVTIAFESGALYTTGAGLAGLPVAVKSPAGEWQWRTIKSNTGTVVTIDTTNGSAWDANPSPGWPVVIGGIEWYQWTPWIDFGVPHIAKKLQEFFVQMKSTSSDAALGIRVRFQNADEIVEEMELTLAGDSGALVWDVDLWDEAYWAGAARQLRKRKFFESPFTLQIQFFSYLPDAPIRIPLWGLGADQLPGMRVESF